MKTIHRKKILEEMINIAMNKHFHIKFPPMDVQTKTNIKSSTKPPGKTFKPRGN